MMTLDPTVDLPGWEPWAGYCPQCGRPSPDTDRIPGGDPQPCSTCRAQNEGERA